MSVGERVKRYAVMVAGIFCISFGVALLTKSDVGTSAISVIPYTLSLLVGSLTYGTWVALFNMLLAVLQIVLLRRDTNFFDIVQQLVLAALFGSVVDLSMFILTHYNPHVYLLRLATLCASVVVLAFGAYLTLISHVGDMAGDGFARAVATVTHKDFGKVRAASDSSMAAVSVVMNLLAFHSLVTVREGTVVSAVCTGLVVGLFYKHCRKFEYALLPGNRSAEEELEVLEALEEPLEVDDDSVAASSETATTREG